MTITLNIDPNRPGINTFTASLVSGGKPVINAQDVSLEFTSLSGLVPGSKATLVGLGNGTYSLNGGYLGMPDQWDIKVVVIRQGKFDAYGDYKVDNSTTTSRPIPWRTLAASLLGVTALCYAFAFRALDANTSRWMGLGLAPGSVDSMTPTSRSHRRASRRCRITWARSSKARYRSSMNAFSSRRSSLSGQDRLRPAERSVGTEPLVEVRGETCRRRHRRRRLVWPPVDRRDVELEVRSGVDEAQLRHAVQADEVIHREIEIDPLAPFALLQVHRLVGELDGRRLALAVPVDRHRQADVLLGLELGDPRAVAIRHGTLLIRFAQLLPDDWIWRANELGSCHVPVEHQAFQNAAELGVSLFVTRKIAGEVIEGSHRSPNIGERQPGEEFAIGHVLRRERGWDGQLARPDARTPGHHPERCAPAQRRDRRYCDRKVVEQEPGRIPVHHPEIRHVRLRIADEKVVDAVFAGIRARGK